MNFDKRLRFLQLVVANTYKNFPDADPRLRATLMTLLQALKMYRKELDKRTEDG